MDESEIKSKLTEDFISSDSNIYVIVIKPDIYRDVDFTLLKELAAKQEGIYINLNIPFSTISEQLKKRGVDISKLSFVDSTGEKSQKNNYPDRLVFVQGPQSLTEISIAISNLANQGKYSFIFFDSVSTLLIYNNVETSEKFIHYFINKLRSMNIKGILISIDEEKSNKLITILSQISDKIIRF